MSLSIRRIVLCAGFGLLTLHALGTPTRADDNAQKPRAFLGTIQVPPDHRQEILQFLHGKGFKGAYVRDDLAPETILYKGTMDEHDLACRAVWKFIEDSEKNMTKSTKANGQSDASAESKPAAPKTRDDPEKAETDVFAKMDLSALQRELLAVFRKEMDKRAEEFRDGTPPDEAKIQRGEDFNKWMHQSYQAILTQAQYDALMKHWGAAPRKIPQDKPPFGVPEDKDRSDEAIFNKLGLSARQAEHLRKHLTWMRDASAKLPESENPQAEGLKINAKWRAGLQRIFTKAQWQQYLKYWDAKDDAF